MEKLYYKTWKNSHFSVTCVFSPKGVCRIFLDKGNFPNEDPYLKKKFGEFKLVKVSPKNSKIFLLAKKMEKFLRDYFSKKNPGNFSSIHLDPRGTSFQTKVWKALIRIPFGKTKTYGNLAKDIQHPKAVRALGTACGANPLPLLIPCHRVLGSQGSFGGFSGGIHLKRMLLRNEGILV